jgi:hypothetical protein
MVPENTILQPRTVDDLLKEQLSTGTTDYME